MLDFYNNYNNLIDPIGNLYPPDFRPLGEALANGLDINVFDEDAAYDMQDTLLSWILDYYGEDLPDTKYMPEIAKFFLDNGYDAKANNGMHGALVLKDFVYSFTCDRNSIECAKLLLDAGADPYIPLYDDSQPLSAYEVAHEHDGDNRGLIEDALDEADYYFALSEMFRRWKEGKDYHSIRHVDDLIGKKIEGIYVEDNFEDVISYEGLRLKAFSKLFIVCDDIVLTAYGDLALIAEDKDCIDIDCRLSDCSMLLEDIIGRTVKEITYQYKRVENWGPTCKNTISIVMDNEKSVSMGDDYLEGPKPTKWFAYLSTNSIEPHIYTRYQNR